MGIKPSGRFIDQEPSSFLLNGAYFCFILWFSGKRMTTKLSEYANDIIASLLSCFICSGESDLAPLLVGGGIRKEYVCGAKS